MSRRKWYAVAAMVVVVTAVALGLVFGLTGGQQSTTGNLASLPPAGGPSEAIQVHGHWTIDVMNPDGSLASHNEFENLFVGAEHTVRILNGSWTAGPWFIYLRPVEYLSPFKTATGYDDAGTILEPCPIHSQNPSHFYTLNKSGNYSCIFLNGSAQAQAYGWISRVETWDAHCSNTTPASQCNCTTIGYPDWWGNSSWFTIKDVSLELLEGQQLLVNVSICFQ